MATCTSLISASCTSLILDTSHSLVSATSTRLISATSHSLISATSTRLISATSHSLILPASSQPWPPVPASSQLPCQGPGADPGFQKRERGGGGVTYENCGVVHFRPIQPVGGGGVLSALGQFNRWGGGGAVHLRLSLYLKRGRVPSTYMAILETTLLPVCFQLTLD